MSEKEGGKAQEEVRKLKSRLEGLKIELEEAKHLAEAKERILNANITELEGLYGKLSKSLTELKTKGYEVKVLNALNSIISTASMHLSLKEILKPTLDVMISSIEELQRSSGRKVNISGGIFLKNEDTGLLELAAIKGIKPEILGCGGSVRPGECLCGPAAEGEIIISEDCLKDPRHDQIHSESNPVEHAHISIPLRSGKDVPGVAFLYVTPKGYSPKASDMTVFTAIGNYLGLHIEKALLYEKVQNLATHDGLTGLFNRREFERLLELEVQRSERYGNDFSLLMVDIDRFKRVNDRYGHPFGDEVLRAFGRIITAELRGFDIAARYGGEEFAVILPETTLKNATRVAERLRKKILGHSMDFQGEPVTVTVSIGAASFLSGPPTGLGLMKAADLALYTAKENGRNRVCHSTGIKVE